MQKQIIHIDDLGFNLRRTLADFFHGAISECDVCSRVEFMEMLAGATPAAHIIQQQMQVIREDWQNSDDDTPDEDFVSDEDFIGCLNELLQNIEGRTPATVQ